MTRRTTFFIRALLGACATAVVSAAEPVTLLDLPGSGTDPEKIDYAALPRLTGRHAVIASAAIDEPLKGRSKIDLHHLRFQLHNYLLHHAGRYWCIWSDGPPIEDEPMQEVRYATSTDGLHWTQSKPVTGTPAAPYGHIARGLWVRDGELLALAAHYKGKGAFGADKELELRAFVWDEPAGEWRFKGRLRDNSINNFAPQRLPSGDWIVTSRDARFNVSMLIGGRKALDDWQSFPVVAITGVKGFRPDEPVIWVRPDASLVGLFRDNGGSQRIFHATSKDSGRTWTQPARSNFPNATSKLYPMQTSRGYRVLVSNANPGVGRRELHLSVSPDGRKFTRMALLDVPTPPRPESEATVWLKFRSGIASLQYPHVIEHDGNLLIAFSRLKKQTELLVVPLTAVDELVR